MKRTQTIYTDSLKTTLITVLLLLYSTAIIQAQTPIWSWSHGIGGAGDDNATQIIADSMGNTYELGFIGSASNTVQFGSFTINNNTNGNLSYLYKYNTTGTVVWVKTFPFNLGLTLHTYAIDTKSNLLVYGYSYLQSIIGHDTIMANTDFIGSIDQNGNWLWAKSKLYGYNLSITGMKKSADGGFIVLGTIADTATIDQIHFPYPCSFVAYLDTIGTFLRVIPLTFDTGYLAAQPHIIIEDIAASSTGSIYISGYYDSSKIGLCSSSWSLPAHYDTVDYAYNFVAKFDNSLHFLWSRSNRFVTTPNSYFANAGLGVGSVTKSHIVTGPDDNVYEFALYQADTIYYDTLAISFPNTYFGPNGSGLLLAKFNGTSGNADWVHAYNTPGSNSLTPSGICSDPLGNIYIAGSFDYSPFDSIVSTVFGNSVPFIAKVSPYGKLKWLGTASSYNGPNTQCGAAQVAALALDGKGDVYIAGLFYLSNSLFATDTLILHTPISGYPYNGDIFTAKIGNCHPINPAISTPSPQHWCGQDSVVLTAPVASEYLWSTGDTGRSMVTRASGFYSVYTADSLGCYAHSVIDTVTVYPQLVLSATVSQEVLCKGDSTGHISLHSIGGTGAVIYSYNPAFADTLHVPAGTYTITATDSANCSARSSLRVSQPNTSLNLLTDSLPSTQAGTGIALVIASGSTPPYTYLWSDGKTMDTIDHLTAGWYEVTVTDQNGCKKTDSVYIRLLTGISSITDDRITLYPNPSNGTFYINMSLQGEVRIFNMEGSKIIAQRLTSGQNKINTEGISSGSYTVEIEIEKNIYTAKIIIDK
jgi:hypothetical protein